MTVVLLDLTVRELSYLVVPKSFVPDEADD